MISSLRPRSIVLLTVALAVIMVGSALLELSQSRNELLHLISEEAVSIVESVEHTSINIVRSTDQIEQQIAERLFNNAFFIASLDSERRLSPTVLRRVCETNDIFRINIVDGRGRRVMSSHQPSAGYIHSPRRDTPAEMLRPLLTGEADTLIIGLRSARYSDGQRYAIAVRRRVPEGGAIVLNVDVATFANLRRSIGIGKMMKDLGDNSGIEYAALQDDNGIIAAGGFVSELSSMENDAELRLMEDADTTITRILSIGGRDIFEVVRPLRVEDEYLGLIRIGLSMEEVRATEARKERRLLVLTVVLFGLSALVAVAVGALQHARIARERVQQVETFTGKILNHMNDAVITIDTSHRITMFNPQAERLFLQSASDVLQQSLDREGWPNECIKGLFVEGPSVFTIEARWPDGTARFLSVSRSFEQRIDGTAESSTAVIRDMTDARRMEQELRDRERLSAMGELAAGVAHEIRNPLNAIAMIAQRFIKEFKPVRGVREYRSIAEVLLSESRRVNGIIQQFLRFARPANPSPSRVDIQAFVDHLVTLMRPEAQQRHVQLRVESSGGTAHFDREQMTQAVLNLLRNALEAAPSKGWISITTAINETHAMITIRDNGPGIPSELKDRVFEPYVSTKASGTGLGLAITRQIVEAHGGRIDVSEGEGATFMILLPVEPNHPVG